MYSSSHHHFTELFFWLVHSYAFQYACRIVVQQDRQEEILDFKEQFKDLLKEFYRRTDHKKPESIIYYRDGVSEGQFDRVLQHEYTQMRLVKNSAVFVQTFLLLQCSLLVLLVIIDALC